MAKLDEIAALYESGETLEEIGEKFGVSRQAISQKLKRIGVTRSSYPRKEVFTTKDFPWAQKRVETAIKRGELVRPSRCEECGSVSEVVVHHDDFNEPLVVRWFCRSCNFKWHRQRQPIPAIKRENSIRAVASERRNLIAKLWGEEKTTAEIATVLECSKNTISRQIFIMRKQGYQVPYRYTRKTETAPKGGSASPSSQRPEGDDVESIASHA